MKSLSRGPRYIFVTGGVLSGVGKGIAAASIGNLLKRRGLKVNIQKCDPYLNVDAGLLNPREHGECFVTHDGAETDLDLGHYERFLDQEIDATSSVMSGRVLLKVIQDERAGKYEGEDVQIIPHLTAAIQEYIVEASKGYDVHIVEIGGTVGDYESLSFIEAIRELGVRVGRENCAYIHVVYLPFLGASQETKTKPAQNSVRDLRALGISPDVLVARSEQPSGDGARAKLSLFSGVAEEAIAQLPNAASIYQVPLTLHELGIDQLLVDRLGLEAPHAELDDWRRLVDRVMSPKHGSVSIGIVAKYLDNEDTYFSVVEAIKSAAWAEGVDVRYEWVNAEEIEQTGHAQVLDAYDAVIVPGGFGTRGVTGKIIAAGYALEKGIPYLGLCLGLQTAVIAAARRGGLQAATTAEMHPESKHNVIYIMADQRGKESTGASMRLGDYTAELTVSSLASRLYDATEVIERHRHRYEVNREFEDYVQRGGLTVSGTSRDGRLVEFVEGQDHPFFIATQAHPEFRSRPLRPHPLFVGLMQAAKQRDLKR